MAIVGAPAYFSARPIPKEPHDLMNHDCINWRQPPKGGLMPWDFKKGLRELIVRVEGQLILNGPQQILDACLRGMGLAFLLENIALEHVAAGRLVRVLDDWCNSFPGYHLYYPSRHQPSATFTKVVSALRYPD